MPLPRQLPKLCLRGSLANITMANMSQDDRDRINDLTIRIANHPELQSKRVSIRKGYAATVGGDYRDDHAIADQEFLIAIWRGVVNLFYHRKYKFRCKACGSAHYRTKRDKLAAIDRQKPVCPNCGKIEVSYAGNSGLLVGQFLPYAEFKEITRDLTDADTPHCRSPIEYIPADRIYEHPETILEDNTQVRKFFGEYAWNYCRQQIRENVRVEHKKAPRTIMGRADEIIVQELVSLCRKMKLDFYYDEETVNYQSFDVYVVGLLTPPEFTVEFCLLRRRALANEVSMTTFKNRISVLKNSNAQIITGKVSTPEHVMYQEECGGNGGDDDGQGITQISYRTHGGERMEPDDHVATIEATDVMEVIRSSLPDGTCQAVFDIVSGQGDIYRQFSEEYGDGTPKKCQIAQFLSVPHRNVGQCRQTIKVVSLQHGLRPR